jgi:hypothetical protein
VYLTPYPWIIDSAKVPILIALVTFSIILTIALSLIGRSLTTEAAPLGIISFELAGSPAQAIKILASWSEVVKRDAFLSLGLDYLYLCVYPLAISLACHLVAASGTGSWRIGDMGGDYLSWLVLAAIPLDGLENYALIRVLKSPERKVWPVVARWCAIPKFGIVILGLVYTLLGLAVQIVGLVM